MRTIILFLLLTLVLFAQAQTIQVVDDKYREDQFYGGVTYNFFENQPNGLQQNGFSLGVHAGFIRDMPINTRRNVALGLGIGLSSSGFNNNILISKKEGNYTFQIIDKQKIIYTINRFVTHMVELPIEFRWRTSTAKEFKFWRIYSGFKLGYVFYNSSRFDTKTETFRLRQINTFNPIQYGVNISVGYNTWNFYVYYALNPIFKEGTQLITNTPIAVRAVKVGLQFYML